MSPEAQAAAMLAKVNYLVMEGFTRDQAADIVMAEFEEAQ